MKTADFHYHLPPELIAQHSVSPRDSSRLLVLNRKTGEHKELVFRDIGAELRAGDVVIYNDSRVFKARLEGVRPARGASPEAKLEVFLVRPVEQSWQVLLRPGKKVQVGDVVMLQEGVTLTVEEKHADGTVRAKASVSASELIALTDRIGQIPVPPYVEKAPDDFAAYQTIFAQNTGSVAAPTAAFHFTPELKASLEQKGVIFAPVTLHVGIGTFMPVKTETLEEHVMHSEWVEIPEATAQLIQEAKAENRRVIALGTTATRALEGTAKKFGQVQAYAGDVNLFITPGFQFQVIDGLITNFHLPQSTLLALVCAFAGYEQVMAAYKYAVEQRFRFFSFGDAMCII